MRPLVWLLLLIPAELIAAEIHSSDCEKDYTNQQWQKAYQSCHTALTQNNSPETEIAILDHLAHINDALGLEQEVLEIDQKIKQHPLFLIEFKYTYNWYRRKGKQAYFSNLYDQSEAYFTEALNLGIDHENLEWQSKSHNDLGVLLKQRGQHHQALQQYQKSLKIKLKLGNDLITANSFYNVGALLLQLERADQAIDYLKEAINLYQKHHDSLESPEPKKLESRINHVNEDLAVAYLKTGHTDQAETYFDMITTSKTKDLNTITELSQNQASTDLALAKYYLSEQKELLAAALLNRALAHNPNQHSPSILLESAKIKVALKDLTGAIEVAHAGLNHAEQEQDHYYLAEFNRLIAEATEAKQPNESIKYLKAYQQAREQFLAQKYSEDIDAINYQIKTHKIERDLIEEQLINTQKEQKISSLTNWILSILMLVIGLLILMIYYYLRKKREQQQLLLTIEYHQQQLLLLNDNKTSNQSVTTIQSTKQNLKQALVKAMVEAVDVWNRHTGQNRIDLAEKSKTWTITIDNGALRARSLDKYLSIKHIPENPRWRKVVRTCHFILSDINLNPLDRKLLQHNLDQIMSLIKGSTMTP